MLFQTRDLGGFPLPFHRGHRRLAGLARQRHDPAPAGPFRQLLGELAGEIAGRAVEQEQLQPAGLEAHQADVLLQMQPQHHVPHLADQLCQLDKAARIGRWHWRGVRGGRLGRFILPRRSRLSVRLARPRLTWLRIGLSLGLSLIERATTGLRRRC